MPVERRYRGIIKHISAEYGKSSLGTSLRIFLPKDSSKINILILAGIHGDEPETTVLLSEALRNIQPNELENAVILCANPDGMAFGTRANANCVDLNRNLPALNWQPDSVHYRYDIDEIRDIELSPGAYASSEPETQSLIKLIDKIRPKQIISIHASVRLH